MVRKKQHLGVFVSEIDVRRKKHNIKNFINKKDILSSSNESPTTDYVDYELIVSESQMTLLKNEKRKIVVTFNTINNGIIIESKDVTNDCVYKSSNENCVTIKNGVITSNNINGESYISIKYENFTTGLYVYVKPLVEYRFNVTPEEINLKYGDSHQFNALLYTITDGKEDEGKYVSTDKSCKWSTSNDKVSINSKGYATVKKSGGNCIITAKYNDLSDTSNINIESITNSNLQITPSELKLKYKEEGQLKVILKTNKDGVVEDTDVTSLCTYTTNVSHISVNKGLIKINDIGGNGIVNVKYKDFEKDVPVMVNSVITNKLQITSETTTLQKNETLNLTATYSTYVDNELYSEINVNELAQWHSINNVVEINKGVVTAIMDNTFTNITAIYNGITSNVIKLTIPKENIDNGNDEGDDNTGGGDNTGDDNTGDDNVEDVITYELDINPQNFYAVKGEKVMLTATVYKKINGIISNESTKKVNSTCQWFTDSEDAVKINKGNIEILKTGVTIKIWAKYNSEECGNLVSNKCTIIVSSETSYRLEVLPSSCTLKKGETQQLQCTFYSTIDGVEESIPVTNDAIYSSTSTDIAVSNTGLVTAINDDARGVISVTYNNVSANVNVTVEEEIITTYDLQLSETNISLMVGESKSITADVYKTVNGRRSLYRSNVTCIWNTTSNENMSIENGTIQALKGITNATVTANYSDNVITSPISSTVIVTIVEPEIIQRYLIIGVYGNPSIYETNMEYILYANFMENSTQSSVTNECSWSVDNENVTINGNKFIINKSGIDFKISATYVCEYGTFNENLTIDVPLNAVEELVVENETTLLYKDFVEPLTIKYRRKEDNIIVNEMDVTENCTYTSLDNTVATVDKHGVIYALKGSSNTQINIRYGDLTNNYNVTVGEDGLEYMHFHILEDDTIISFSKNNLEYSIDEGITWDVFLKDTQYTFNRGRIYFKANIINTSSTSGIGTFSVDKNFYVGGNVLSLTSGDLMTDDNIKSISSYYLFYKLFSENKTLLKVSKKLLPATVIINMGYNYMFYNCINLINAPDLLSTDVRAKNYNNMFEGCESLRVPPIIKETIFSESCNSMFRGCKNLLYVHDMELTGTYQSFQSMYENCNSLKDVSNITIGNMGILACLTMFRNCGLLEVSPTIIGSAVGQQAGRSMFENCSNLKFIKYLGKNITGEYALSNWVKNVAPKGKFVKSSDAEWDIIGNNGVPTGWEIVYEGIYVSSTNSSNIVAVGDKFKINCLGDNILPSSNTLNDITSSCTFSSTNNSITVDSLGIATVVGETENGECTLVISYMGNTKTLNLIIENPQQYVCGYVRDINNIPIEGVNVSIYGGDAYTISDENGYYRINKLYKRLENSSLIFIKEGYDNYITPISNKTDINVTINPIVCSESFNIDRTILYADIFGASLQGFNAINIHGLSKEDAENLFSWSHDDNDNGLFDTYNPPSFTYRSDNTGQFLDSDVNIEENKGRQRIGYLTLSHKGGWCVTIVIIQKGMLQIEDIPSDAYKEIIPEVTPWIRTYNQQHLIYNNWGRAEKVLYLTGEAGNMPSVTLYIPGATENTEYDYLITECDSYSTDTLGDYVHDIAKGELNDSTVYPLSKTHSFSIGARNFNHITNVTYRSVVITFLIKNYDNKIGNYIAIPFRIVQCRRHICEKDFNKIVEIYGPSNYDGTMNNLDDFGFGDLPTPDEISIGNTSWIQTNSWSWTGETRQDYGICNRVLYMTNENVLVPARVTIVGSLYDLTCACKDGKHNNVLEWVDDNFHTTGTTNNGISITYKDFYIGSRSNFEGSLENNHRVIYLNFKVRLITGGNPVLKDFNIPFTIVQCRKNITLDEFNNLVQLYGPSNYDGSMGKLDEFNFEDPQPNDDIPNKNIGYIDVKNAVVRKVSQSLVTVTLTENTEYDRFISFYFEYSVTTSTDMHIGRSVGFLQKGQKTSTIDTSELMAEIPLNGYNDIFKVQQSIFDSSAQTFNIEIGQHYDTETGEYIDITYDCDVDFILSPLI